MCPGPGTSAVAVQATDHDTAPRPGQAADRRGTRARRRPSRCRGPPRPHQEAPAAGRAAWRASACGCRRVETAIAGEGLVRRALVAAQRKEARKPPEGSDCTGRNPWTPDQGARHHSGVHGGGGGHRSRARPGAAYCRRPGCPSCARSARNRPRRRARAAQPDAASGFLRGHSQPVRFGGERCVTGVGEAVGPAQSAVADFLALDRDDPLSQQAGPALRTRCPPSGGPGRRRSRRPPGSRRSRARARRRVR